MTPAERTALILLLDLAAMQDGYAPLHLVAAVRDRIRDIRGTLDAEAHRRLNANPDDGLAPLHPEPDHLVLARAREALAHDPP
jgi:hypothetical protein